MLAFIAPPALRRESATLALGHRACISGHLLHDAMRSANPKRVKSRNSFAHNARLLTALTQELAEHWIQARRTESWASTTTTLHQFMPTPSTIAAGADFSLRTWTRLNRLRSGIGRFGASMLRWGLVKSDRCDWGSQNGRPRNQRTLPCLSTTRGRARIRGAGRNYAQVALEDRT